MFLVSYPTVDVQSRLESERATRQKADLKVLELEMRVNGLVLDNNQLQQREATLNQGLHAESEKVRFNVAVPLLVHIVHLLSLVTCNWSDVLTPC